MMNSFRRQFGLGRPSARPETQRGLGSGFVVNKLGMVLTNNAEIAKANGHPEWQADIRATFAKRWVANAKAGWYYNDGSGWKLITPNATGTTRRGCVSQWRRRRLPMPVAQPSSAYSNDW